MSCKYGGRERARAYSPFTRALSYSRDRPAAKPEGQLFDQAAKPDRPKNIRVNLTPEGSQPPKHVESNALRFRNCADETASPPLLRTPVFAGRFYSPSLPLPSLFAPRTEQHRLAELGA